MSKRKLKTAVLGLDDKGQLLLKAAADTDYFHIQAVADKDTTLAKKTALTYNCTPYDDYRQLIVQDHFDTLLVAAPLYTCDEYIKTAIKKKFNILKLAPPARNFEEAAQLVRLAENQNVKFAVANPSRFSQSFLAMKHLLQQKQIEKVFLITALCALKNEKIGDWQTDPKLAGGGVLLRNCYHIIDQIILNFALPQQVYSLNTNQAEDRQQRLYLTENTAIVNLKFNDTLFANLIAGRTFGPQQQLLKVYGKNKILTIETNTFTVTDSRGQNNEKSHYQDNEISSITKMLENFALSLLCPDNNKLSSTAAENLNNMAVIESAYLSARTGMPEEPARILQMAQTNPTILWQGHKL